MTYNMKTRILLPLICLLATTTGNAQTWNWAQNIGNTSEYSVREMVKGNHNDVFTCGRMNQTTTFGTITVTPPVGSSVGYIARLDTLGNYIWAKTFDVDYIDLMDIEVNSNNELILVAAVHEDVVLDTVAINYDLGENVVLVMNENGEILKKRNFGTRFLAGTSSNYNIPIAKVTLDSQDNPIISFSYRDTAFFQSQILVANPFVSTYGLVKLDTDLNDVWVKAVSFAGIWDLQTDYNNDIILVGEVNGNTAFDTVQTGATCGVAGYIAKLDNQSGNAPTFVWTKLIQSSGPCASGQIMLSSHFNSVEIGTDNSIYVSGDFMNNVMFGNIPITPFDNMTINSNMLVAKLSTNGAILWHKQAQNKISYASDLSVDLCGNVTVIGSYKYAFDMGTGSYPWQNNGEISITNLFVSYLDSAGTVQWVNTAEVNATEHQIEMITPTRIWTGGQTQYIAPVFGTVNPGGSADYSFFLAQISQSAAASCMDAPWMGLSVAEISKSDLFQVFPNPASTQWTIVLKDAQDQSIVRLLDATGKEVKQWSFEGVQMNVQRESLTSGLYYLQVLDTDSQLIGTQKLVIQ